MIPASVSYPWGSSSSGSGLVCGANGRTTSFCDVFEVLWFLTAPGEGFSPDAEGFLVRSGFCWVEEDVERMDGRLFRGWIIAEATETFLIEIEESWGTISENVRLDTYDFL